jgi:hypothetical protein
MKSKLISTLSLFTILASVNASAQTQSWEYALTSNTYTENDNIEAAVINEFGPGSVVADWNEIKQNFSSNIEQFCDDVGLINYRNGAMCLRGGAHFWSGNRHYFMERHEHNVPGGWAVHDQIANNFLDLGSWYGINKLVLAKIPLQLSIANLSPGQTATLTVSAAEPGATVVPLFSLTGSGPTTTSFGFDLDLSQPITRRNSLTVDPNGVAIANYPVPVSAIIGTSIWIQAVEVSPVSTYRVSILLSTSIQ